MNQGGEIVPFINQEDQIAFEMLDDMSDRHKEERKRQADQRQAELEALSDDDLELGRLQLEAQRESLYYNEMYGGLIDIIEPEDYPVEVALSGELGEIEFEQIRRKLASKSEDLPPAA